MGRLLAQFTGQELLIARLLYGCGFRLGDCVSLRVKDVDFELNQIVVRDSKGMKSRVAILPKMACEDLRKQIAARRIEHQRDLDEGYGTVYLPYALARKYPKAEREFGWQYVFAAKRRVPLAVPAIFWGWFICRYWEW